jgi:hypothetical protein
VDDAGADHAIALAALDDERVERDGVGLDLKGTRAAN